MTTIEALETRIAEYPKHDRQTILKAAAFARDAHQNQWRESGDPYVTHPLQVAEILIGMHLDATAISAALLHDVLEDTHINHADLYKRFGPEIAKLVDGVTKISSVRAHSQGTREAQTIHKMLLAMIKDVRVILIKLADKLHNMRTLGHKQADRRLEIAQECFDIYAPLAGRLGISWLHNELEDLAFSHLQPAIYKHIREFIDHNTGEAQAHLRKATEIVMANAKRRGLKIVAETRVKYCYSVYRKMQQTGRSLVDIFDLLGLRILCRSEEHCYMALGMVHHLWPPVDGCFRDYIAIPKSNRYQSLHTTVLCEGANVLEIQIRTHNMHRFAEYGIAAHWFYKQGASPTSGEDLEIMQQARALERIGVASSQFLDEIKRDLLRDTIYVFTPKGDGIQLPTGAIAIDFAYHIHTEIGEHAQSARADGVPIGLKDELTNTQVIEILTDPKGQPQLSWLRVVRTSRARARIRSWLNKHDSSVIIDQNVVAHTDRIQSPGMVYANRGNNAKSQYARHAEQNNFTNNAYSRSIHFAGCCDAQIGDNIIGYASHGRGIIVHQRNCPNLTQIRDLHNRTIEVEWESLSPLATVSFKVLAHKINTLFSDIEAALRHYGARLIEGRIEENDHNGVDAWFSMEIDRQKDVRQVLETIRNTPGIMEAEV